MPFESLTQSSMIADNLRAINDYFHRTTAKTAQAAALQSDWSAWWIATGSPSNYYFTIPQSVMDEASNRRLAFQIANAITPQEKQMVQRVATSGISAEQAQGLPERRDPTTGLYHIPPKPLLSNTTKTVLVGAGVVAVGYHFGVFHFLRKLVALI